MAGYTAKSVCSRSKGLAAKSTASHPPQTRSAATQTRCACADVVRSCRERSCELLSLQILLQECSERLRGLFIPGFGGHDSSGIDNSRHETVSSWEGGAGESDSDNGGESPEEQQVAITLRPHHSADGRAPQQPVDVPRGDSPDMVSTLASSKSDSDGNERDSDDEPSLHQIKARLLHLPKCAPESESNSERKASAEKKAVGKQSAAKDKLKVAASGSKQTEGGSTAQCACPQSACPKQKRQIVKKANVPADVPAKRLCLQPLKLLWAELEKEEQQKSQTTPTELTVTIGHRERCVAEKVLSSSPPSPPQSPNKMQLRNSKALDAESSGSAEVIVATRDSSCEDLERGSQPQACLDKRKGKGKDSVETASPKATGAAGPGSVLQRELGRVHNPLASAPGAASPAALHQDKVQREFCDLMPADLGDLHRPPTQHSLQQDSDAALSRTAWQTMIPDPNLQDILNVDVKEEVLSSASSPPASQPVQESGAKRKRKQKNKMANSDDAGALICNNCGKQFSSLRNLHMHRTKSTRCRQRRATLRCLDPGCLRRFWNSETLRQHAKMVHAKIMVYPCDYCPRQFKRRVVLVKHLRRFHVQPMALEAAAAPPDDTDPCALCGHPATNRLFLEVHMARHLHGGKYVCMECLTTFNYDVQLARHIKSDHPDSPKELQNPDLSKNIRKIADLEIESDKNCQPQFHCSFCDKSYTYLHGLNKHRRWSHPIELGTLEGDDAPPTKDD